MRHPNPRRIVLTAVVTLCLSMPNAVMPGELSKIKLGTLAPKGSVYYRVLQELGEEWRHAQGEHARFIIYADGSQGGEADVVRRMRVGQLNAAMLTAVGLAEIDKGLAALQFMPMMFRSWEEVDFVRETIIDELDRRLRERGYVALFWGDAGWVQLFSKTPTLTPRQLQQRKLFAWSGAPDQVTIMKSMGYHPIVLETSDILPALETGLIDAAAVTPMFALAGQIDAAAPHMLQLNWAPIVGAAVMTLVAWSSLTPEVQEVLRHAGAAATLELRAGRVELEQDAVDAMARRGLTVHRLTPESEREWRELAASAHPLIRGNMVPAEVFDRVKFLLEQYRSTADPQG